METAGDWTLAGSTVGFDQTWIRGHMPRLAALFSHKVIDVSSITQLAKRWAPRIYEGRPSGVVAHRVAADIIESINYLKYYRATGFIDGSGCTSQAAEEAISALNQALQFAPMSCREAMLAARSVLEGMRPTKGDSRG
jgi:oligoribonuclease